MEDSVIGCQFFKIFVSGTFLSQIKQSGRSQEFKPSQKSLGISYQFVKNAFYNFCDAAVCYWFCSKSKRTGSVFEGSISLQSELSSNGAHIGMYWSYPLQLEKKGKYGRKISVALSQYFVLGWNQFTSVFFFLFAKGQPAQNQERKLVKIRHLHQNQED